MNTIVRTLASVACIATALAATAMPPGHYGNNCLPDDAQNFLSQYFPDNRIAGIKTEYHPMTDTEYEVRLDNGTEVEFDSGGQWKSVDCGSRAVPQALIPRDVLSHLLTNFGGSKTVKLEKEHWGYEVELNDGIEVNYDRAGNFISAELDDDD